MNLLIAFLLIIFEAVPEALCQRGNKTIAGVIEFFYRAAFTILLFAGPVAIWYFSFYSTHYWYVISGYILIRFAIFDLIYNLVAGNVPFYIGTVKLSDKVQRVFFRWTKFSPEHFMFMVKLLTLIIGIVWILK